MTQDDPKAHKTPKMAEPWLTIVLTDVAELSLCAVYSWLQKVIAITAKKQINIPKSSNAKILSLLMIKPIIEIQNA